MTVSHGGMTKTPFVQNRRTTETVQGATVHLIETQDVGAGTESDYGNEAEMTMVEFEALLEAAFNRADDMAAVQAIRRLLVIAYGPA